VDPDASTVITDPARLKQILYNYLSNAIKFTPPGGSVQLRIGPESPATFRIDVEDSGIGISEENLARLFVEFQQIDGSAAKEYQGTGLGLALTKRLAEALGGRVAVRSTRGEGSTFSAILPRVVADPDPDRRHEAVHGLSLSPADNPTVLVVDDDRGSLKLADAALRELGCRPVCMEHAGDALLELDLNPPAAVVVDLLMPVMSGFEFITRLRATRAGHDLPVIVWTVKDLDAEERRRLQSLGVSIVAKRAGGATTLTDELRQILQAGTVGGGSGHAA
jgi:CheY-like chemotaxis protein